ncbi:TonB-dependent receptor [Phaeodactylibacter luteus]|uniref:TonB-dependent receptor n=2 Tax=Phaeodactylibacter luteus TaxID=1564516 RepID=A0A5C6S4W8_9BACT|nr:TonB-dependent receptor [Phaeodactylibacter luteus]
MGVFDQKNWLCAAMAFFVASFFWASSFLQAQGTDTDSIALSLSTEEVVVTAQYSPVKAAASLHEVRVLNRALIEARGANSLEQLLQQETGVRIGQDRVLGSRLSLLGTDGQQVRILIDGVPVLGRQDGHIDLGQINLQQIARVEIVEGPMSVVYGTDAIGGVINLITKKAVGATPSLELQALAESRAERNASVSLLAPLGSKWGLRLGGNWGHFTGVGQDSLRAMLWNPKEQLQLDGVLHRSLGHGRLALQSRYFAEVVASPGNLRRPQFRPYAFDDRFFTRRIDQALNFEGRVGANGYLKATAALNHFLREKNTFRLDMEADTTSLVEGMQDTSSLVGAMARAAYSWAKKEVPLQFQVGIDARYDEGVGARLGQDTVNAPIDMADVAGFASVRFRPSRFLQLELGGRYAWNDRYQAPVVPSLQLKIETPSGWQWRAGYGRGFRSPGLKELFFNFIDINHFIIGNPKLGAEISDNVQIGLSRNWEKKGARWGINAKLFYNYIQDKIGLFEFVELPEGIAPAVDTSTLRFTYFNQAKYIAQGSRMEAFLKTSAWDIRGSAAVVGYYQPLSEEAPDLPKFTYALELSGQVAYSIQPIGLNIALMGRYNDRHVSYFPSPTAGELAGQRIQDGFFMADLTLRKALGKEKQLSLTAGARNLLDVRQANVTGADGGGAHSVGAGAVVVSPGRSFFLQAAWRLSLKKGG